MLTGLSRRLALATPLAILAGCGGSDDGTDDQPSGLVAYYPFSGNAKDQSGNGNDGVLQGPVAVPDRRNAIAKAYNFDGIDDAIAVAHSETLTIAEDITLAAWIRPEAQKDQVIMRKGTSVNSPYELALTEEGDLCFNLRIDGDKRSVTTPGYEFGPDIKFYFVAGTYDGRIMRLYVGDQGGGGVEERASLAMSGSLDEDTASLYIGTRTRTENDTFQGDLDEIRVYHEALQPGVVSSLGQNVMPVGAGRAAQVAVIVLPNHFPLVVPLQTPASQTGP